MSKISLQVIGEATVESCFSDYIGKCEVRNLSERTIATYRIHFRIFQRYLNDTAYPAEAVTVRTVDGFILHLKGRGCNCMTVQSYLRDMSRKSPLIPRTILRRR